MSKKRLDILLVERELVESRQRAQALILAGKVAVNDSAAVKAGTLVEENANIVIRESLKYVSRGGLKLEGALDTFGVEPRGKICADVGSSTGGFTDCLLQRGAARVYALDVGYGQLAWKLRSDARVIVMERVNARYLQNLPELIDLATIDVSFISLTQILPAVKLFLQPHGQAVALVKPQFEAGRDEVGKGGIVRDVSIHRAVVEKIAQYALGNHWSVLGLCRSPITGMDGNVEFFVHLSSEASDQDANVNLAIAKLFKE